MAVVNASDTLAITEQDNQVQYRDTTDWVLTESASLQIGDVSGATISASDTFTIADAAVANRRQPTATDTFTLSEASDRGTVEKSATDTLVLAVTRTRLQGRESYEMTLGDEGTRGPQTITDTFTLSETGVVESMSVVNVTASDTFVLSDAGSVAPSASDAFALADDVVVTPSVGGLARTASDTGLLGSTVAVSALTLPSDAGTLASSVGVAIAATDTLTGADSGTVAALLVVGKLGTDDLTLTAPQVGVVSSLVTTVTVTDEDAFSLIEKGVEGPFTLYPQQDKRATDPLAIIDSVVMVVTLSATDGMTLDDYGDSGQFHGEPMAKVSLRARLAADISLA